MNFFSKTATQLNLKLNSLMGLLILFALLVDWIGAYGQEQELLDAYSLYRKGAYQQALEKLNEHSGMDKKQEATAHYLRGLSYSRLQNFNDAAKHLAQSILLNIDAPDAYYELGQALYASQQLEEAQRAFKKSAKGRYKPGASLYYSAYIHQILENLQDAKDEYEVILRLKTDPDKIKQSAKFQLAELFLTRAEQIQDEVKKKSALKSQVLPQYDRTIDHDDETPIAIQAKMRIRQIKSKYFPKKPSNWSFRLTQDIKYDTNVITQADQAAIDVSKKNSFISKTGLSVDYRFKGEGYMINPRLGAYSNYHFRRETPRVFQNDDASLDPGVNTRMSYTLFEMPSATTFDLVGNYTLRDHQQRHAYLFYQRYLQFSFGQRLAWSRSKVTTVTAKFKTLKSQDKDYTGRTPALDISQVYPFFGMAFNFSLSGDFQRLQNPNNDLDTYRLSASTSFSDIWWEIDLRPSLAISLINTKLQKSTRGVEKLVDPSVSFTRKLGESFDASFRYAFTRRFSKDKANYHYKKHVITLGFGVSF